MLGDGIEKQLLTDERLKIRGKERVFIFQLTYLSRYPVQALSEIDGFGVIRKLLCSMGR